ncbi:MAG TPA: EAL domain-containing protein, partial [Rhodocyclaceae bacterium]
RRAAALLWLCLVLPLGALAAEPQPLTVVSDDTYPPYIFRNAEGALDGYLVDIWKLWERKTGTPVRLVATDWAQAQQVFAEGKADVIDTIFRTPEREKTMVFSKPYADLAVPIYVHRDIGGITDVASLRGFLVGAKAGDACVDRLKAQGVDNLQTFASYVMVVEAAKARRVNIFCLDEPPANYLLYRAGVHQEFRRAFTLYTGQFHRAVKRGNEALLQRVQQGFEAITPAEESRLRDKWLGSELNLLPWGRYLGYGMVLLLLLGAGVLAWGMMLRRAVRDRTARLEDEQGRLRTLINTLPDLVWLKDPEGVYLACNLKFERFFGASEAQILGKTDYDFVPAELASFFREHDRKAIAAGRPSVNEERVTYADDGHEELLETIKTPMHDARGRLIGVLGIARDITQWREDERRLKRLNQLYQVLSHAGEAIARHKSEEALFHAVCQILVQDGGIRMAWVGLPDPAAGELRPVGWAGVIGDYLEHMHVSLFDDERGGSPPGVAFREGRFDYCRDMSQEARMEPWRERATALGYRSSTAFPLKVKKHVRGVITLYSDDPEFFDADEIALLERLAVDVGLAMASIQTNQLLRLQGAALEAAANAIMVTNTDGTVQWVNPAFSALTGYSPSEAIGSHPRVLLRSGLQSGEVYADLWQTILSGEVWCGQLINRRKDGSHYVEDQTITPVRGVDGEITHFVAIKQDVTERKRAEDQLRQAAAVFHSTREGIVVTDLSGSICAVNPAFSEITGYDEAEVLGQRNSLLKSSHHDEDFYRHMWAAIVEHGGWQGEIWNRRKNGEPYPIWMTISTVRNQQGKPMNYVGVFSDITRIKESEADLKRMAHHDALTGLPNRLLLLSRLEHAVVLSGRTGSRGAVLFIDLDRFKDVNDSLGHPVGDELLQYVARRLQGRLREADTLARLGGDEFVVLLEGINSPDDAALVAETLIDQLRSPCLLSGGHSIYLGCSIGISLYPEDSNDPNELIQFADTALYQSKNQGRGVFNFYTKSLGAIASRRMSLESALRRALTEHEFVVHYQPLIDLADNRPVGIEALVRWLPPSGGLIPPDQFIPLAEETGLIVPLGSWVLRRACAQVQDWRRNGLAIETLAVNVSPRQLRRDEFPEEVAAILAEFNLPADLLELELTESALMDQGEAALDRLARLKSIGVRLAVDDFGTGYSSLAYLKRFPIDKLKVDRSFVRDIPMDPADMEIAATIIAMAKNLKLKVLAEGVESPEQLAFLVGRGCEYGQGYLFSKPLAPEDYLQWRRSGGGQG